MNAADPIRRVSVLSTGKVAIRPEHIGPTTKSQTNWLLTSRSWTAPLPINVYVIEHERGLVLFDTGQDRASVTDSDYFPGGPLRLAYSRLARFEIGEDDTLTAQLAGLGYRIDDVTKAIVSHLHQDHIGGLRELAHADILISEEEWATLSRPRPAMHGLLKKHIMLPGLKWQPIRLTALPDDSLSPFTQGLDLFGDGTMTILPTPGHTAGSISLLVRQADRPPLLFIGDLSYDNDLFERGEVPGSGDRAGMQASTALVNQLRKTLPGLVVLGAHDPSAAPRLERALVAQS